MKYAAIFFLYIVYIHTNASTRKHQDFLKVGAPVS